MCGICGVVYSHPERPVDKQMLRQMTDIMVHRGPDSDGFYVAPGIGLGIRRLSIIDLETGDQPISNEDETVTVVCNGEIYNFEELRQELMAAGHRFRTHSDVEVIVHLYEDHGVECINYLRGMFGFALWDTRARRLILARDRLGIKPLLYAFNKDGLFFGSELKSILMSRSVEREIDVLALRDLLTVGFVLGSRTLFNNIHRLLPGQYLLYENGVLSTHQYWDMHFPATQGEVPQMSTREWAEALRARLEESVRVHLRSDVPVGAWLSAGIDSSSVVSLMSRLTTDPVETFTLAFENPRFDEVGSQKILKDFDGYNLSSHLSVFTSEHFNLIPKAVWHCEDPVALGSGLSRMVLSQLASENVKVVLTGEGSDEIFGGYSWFKIFKLLEPLSNLPPVIRQIIARIPALRKRWPRAIGILGAPPEMNLNLYKIIINSGHEKLFVNSGFAEIDENVFSDQLRQGAVKQDGTEDNLDLPQDFDKWHPFSQLQYFEIKVRLSDFITRQLDLASMAYSLEVRVPFLDHELVELCAQIPPGLKMRALQEKHILRRAMHYDLPPEIVRRKKRGMISPFVQWTRNLPEFAMELLSEDQIQKKGYFNPKFVTQMLEQNRSGKASYGRSLMGVLGVQLWDDLFLKGCRPVQQ